MRKLVVVVLVLVVLAAGVWWMRRGGDGAVGPGADVASLAPGDPDAPLAFVPADTPYLFANLEPFPADVTRHWLQQLDMGAQLWQSQIGTAIARLEQSEPAAEQLKWLRALDAELEGKSMAQVFDALGYDLSGRFALYGVGLAPVLRLSLADPDRFRAFLARLERQVGAPFPRAEVDGQEYFPFAAPDGKVRGILALQQRQLVLTLAPPDDDAALRLLLGLQRPAASLRDGETLVALNREFGYRPHGSGYVDVRALLAQFTAAPTPLETAFLSAFEVPKPVLEPACVREYEALAQSFPRLSFGYTRLDAQRMDMVSRLETSAAIAADLQQLRAPMPGLAQVGQAPFNVGVSLKLAALPPLVSKWAAAVAAAPWQCPSLAPLNESFAQSNQQLANPVVFGAAPVFEGVHAIATRLELKPGGAPPEFGGKLLIGSPNPGALLAMAKGFAPPLADLQLDPDGQVHALPALPNVPPELPAHVAMTPNVIGLALGPGEEADLPRYLAADPAQQPLFVLGYSGALFAQFNRQMLESTAAIADPAQQQEQREAAELIGRLYAQIKRAEIRLEFGERGIEMHQRAELN